MVGIFCYLLLLALFCTQIASLEEDKKNFWNDSQSKEATLLEEEKISW